MITGILATAASGLNLNAQRVQTAATNIANVSTTGYKAARTDAGPLVSRPDSVTDYTTGGALELSTTDLATEFVNLILAETAYSASLKALQTGEQMSDELLNINA